jgi:hypothetical protein
MFQPETRHPEPAAEPDTPPARDAPVFRDHALLAVLLVLELAWIGFLCWALVRFI